MKNCSEKETSDCGCTGKGQFHQEIDSLWPEMPDELKDMMRSLHQQKKAVLEKVKMWAELSHHDKLRKICDEKIKKVQQRISEEENS